MGPVEILLRRQLREGLTVSRAEALAKHGQLAIVLLDRWVRRGFAERDGDGVAFKVRAIPASTSAAIEARQQLTARAEEEGERQAALERAKRATEKRNALSAQIAAAGSDAERRKIIEDSRTLQLAEDALAALEGQESAVDLSLFGIELADGGR